MKRAPHAAFWWLWALLIAIATLRTSSSALSVVSVIAITYLAFSAGIDSRRTQMFLFALRFAGIALAIRMLFAIAISVPLPGREIFTLPQLQLPEFLVGIRVGGPVTLERLASAFNQGSLFAVMILVFALANALTTPTRLIKALPGSFYGFGVATTLATSITPSLASSVARIRTAQFLRGQPDRGMKSWRRLGTPVLEESLARSIDLAAALEARGYGRSTTPTKYRPDSWRPEDILALLGAAYLAFLFPFLDLNELLEISIFAVLLLVPAVLR